MTASLSWNDGFYSNRYTWLTGSLAYAFNSANTLSFTAGGNFGQTVFRTRATPVQNNSTIYDLIYAYSKAIGSFNRTGNTPTCPQTKKSES